MRPRLGVTGHRPDFVPLTETLQGLSDATLTVTLAPGRYLVEPGLRPCSGHCSQRLAARTATCETTVDVPATRQLRVRHVVNMDCTVGPGDDG